MFFFASRKSAINLSYESLSSDELDIYTHTRGVFSKVFHYRARASVDSALRKDKRAEIS